MADRAQSEVVGFVLVFALVVSTVALTSVVGFSGLQEAQAFERTGNAEAAFGVLAANLDDIAHDGAPSRTTELDVVGAELAVGDPVTIVVNVTSAADPDRNATYPVTIRPIVYETREGVRLVYANGAVVRDDGDGMVMLRDPELLVSGDRTVLQLVQTGSRQERSVSGTGILVRTEATGRELLVANTSRHEVSITLDSPRAAIWQSYLESPDVSCNRTGSTVECTLTSDQVYVTVSRIAVTLS